MSQAGTAGYRLEDLPLSPEEATVPGMATLPSRRSPGFQAATFLEAAAQWFADAVAAFGYPLLPRVLADCGDKRGELAFERWC